MRNTMIKYVFFASSHLGVPHFWIPKWGVGTLSSKLLAVHSSIHAEKKRMGVQIELLQKHCGGYNIINSVNHGMFAFLHEKG